MKKAIVILFLVIAGTFSVAAQDIITLRSGQELKARILRLNPKDLVFIPENSSDTLSLLREEVNMLRYRSGTIIYLSAFETPVLNNEPANDSLYLLGERDAVRYYRGYKAAATGTLLASFFIPLGLIPAIACSSTPPSAKNLGYRDQNLIKNPGYYDGYTDKAYKIKKKKVWQNFTIGTGVMVAYYFIIVAASISLM